MTWFSVGEQTGVVAANAVLADTGPLAAGNYNISVLIAGNIVLVVRLEHRNAANNATIKDFVLCVNGTTFDYTFPDFFAVAEGERFRILLRVATLTGAGFHANLRASKEPVQ